jgi:hypothetical protein
MIFLECDNDEAVVRGLGFPRGSVEHHASKGRVAKFLQKATGGRHIGLIDQDPGSSPPAYFREFTITEQRPQLGLVRYRHRQEAKELIEIQPDLEPWLYAAAQQAGLRPKDFHLPERHSLLHDNPKAHARHVRSFIMALLEANSQHLLTLQAWLSGCPRRECEPGINRSTI